MSLGSNSKSIHEPLQRNQAGRIDDLAAGMDLGPVMVDEQARRPVQLAHHHPLGAVDDERAVLGHQGQGAEIDLLLLDVPDGLGLHFRPGLVNHQADSNLHGDFEGHAPLLALVHVVLGVPQAVFHELQGTGAAEVLNRENTLEDAVEAIFRARLRRQVFLQETAIGLLLHLNEIGDVHNPLDLAKILSV